MQTPEVKQLLDRHKSLRYDEETQKIKCSLTKHEMPAKASAIESYVNGNKYKRLAGMKAFKYEEHKTHIVPSDKKLNQMFCRLTLRHLQKTPKAIELHISGRKYKNALARWNECQKTGKKFIAHIRRKAKRPKDSDNDSIAGSESLVEDESDDPTNKDDEDEDDMSDLYPEADFKEEDGASNDEEEEEEDTVTRENVPPKAAKSAKKQKTNKKKNGEKVQKGASKSQKETQNDKSPGTQKRSMKHSGKDAVVRKKMKM